MSGAAGGETGAAARAAAETDAPRLAPGVALRRDPTRGQWTLLGPERVLMLDEIAFAIVAACVARPGGDAAPTVGDGCDRLAADFSAPRDEIAADAIALLTDLRDRGFVTLCP